MKVFLLSLLFLPSVLLGATGDILGAFVKTNGTVISVQIEGMATNTTVFFNGFGTYNIPTTSNNLTLTLTRMAFDYADSVVTTSTVTKTILGTISRREAYPNEGLNTSLTNGANGIWCEVALSEPVYLRDSNIVANLRAGSFVDTNAAVESVASSSLSVTNESVQPYQPPVGNWTFRGYRVYDGPEVVLRAVGAHSSAKVGRPVQAVMLWIKDSGGTSFTNWQTEMQVDWTTDDALHFGEYVARFNTNLFASGLILCNVLFVPWEGDQILNSSTTGYVDPTPHLCPLTNAVNWPRVRAIVDLTGNDSTGVAAAEYFWETNTSPASFASIGGALQAIYATNNTVYSRAGWSGGIVKVNSGMHVWYKGSSFSLANGPFIEAVIEPSDGASIIITNGSDKIATQDKDLWRIRNARISSYTTIFQTAAQGWLDGCRVQDNVGSVFVDSVANPNNWIMTGCFVSNLVQGLKLSPLDNAAWVLLRGNTLSYGVKAVDYYTAVGNISTTPDYTTNAWVSDSASAQERPAGFPAIVFNNALYNQRLTPLSCGQYFGLSNGAWFANNIVESAHPTDSSAQTAFCNEYYTTNLLIWNNNFLGAGCQLGYNNAGGVAIPKSLWNVENNIFEKPGTKGDEFADDGALTGAWDITHGTGFAGNYNGETVSDQFMWRFPGIGSYQKSGLDAEPPNVFGFVFHGGWDSVSLNGSPGDYRLTPKANTLFRVTPQRQLLPFDIGGRRRTKYDPSGAVSAGTTRGGGMF